MIFLKYEHLVAEPRRVQNLLADCLELEFHGDFGNFHPRELESYGHDLMAPTGPDIARPQKWRAPHHRARIVDQFTRFPALHDIVVDLGYEQDIAWYDTYLAETGEVAATA